MQYALLSRFQGAIAGAIVGEAIGRYPLALPPRPKLAFDHLTRFYAESLINPDRLENPGDPILQACLGPAEAAIALLPVFLYFHENSLKLKQNLQAVLDVWRSDSGHLAELQVVGNVISQTLLERLDLRTFMDGILETPSLAAILQAQTLLGQSVSLEDAVKSIQKSGADPAIALALYCFASTAGEFRLSVLRSLQAGYQVPVICALTGALSGAYNSFNGIPIAWRLALETWTSATGESRTQAQTRQLATQLLRQWSGIYDPRFVLEDSPAPVVAAPQVIRRHP